MSQLPVALRRPQKNTPLDFWSMHLVDFVDFLGHLRPAQLVHTLIRVPTLVNIQSTVWLIVSLYWAPNSNLANLVIYGVFLKNQHFAT